MDFAVSEEVLNSRVKDVLRVKVCFQWKNPDFLF